MIIIIGKVLFQNAMLMYPEEDLSYCTASPGVVYGHAGQHSCASQHADGANKAESAFPDFKHS